MKGMQRAMFNRRVRRNYKERYGGYLSMTITAALWWLVWAFALTVTGRWGLAAVNVGFALAAALALAVHYARFAAEYWRAEWWEVWKEVEYYRAVHGEIDDVNRAFYGIRDKTAR